MWKHVGWFFDIRSMEYGLSTLLKRVGFLMRFFKLCDAQKCSKNVLETSVSKSRRTIKLTYFEEYKSVSLPMQCKWSAIKFVFGLHKNDSSHFLTLKLVST